MLMKEDYKRPSCGSEIVTEVSEKLAK